MSFELINIYIILLEIIFFIIAKKFNNFINILIT